MRNLRSRFRALESPRNGGEPFLRFNETWHSSRRAGFGDVCEYVWSTKPAERQEVPARVAARIAAIGLRAERVFELGPGTGAFARVVLRAFPAPDAYAVCDSDADWLRYSGQAIRDISPETRVRQLHASRADELNLRSFSLDFAHAHAVFVQLRHEATRSYFGVIAEALQPRGVFVCDFLVRHDSIREQPSIPWGVYWAPSWISEMAHECGLKIESSWQEPFGTENTTTYFYFVAT